MKSYIKLIAVLFCMGMFTTAHAGLWESEGGGYGPGDDAEFGSVSAGIPVYDHTSDATLTEAHCRGKNTNQGASAEVDLTMNASDQGDMVMFENQEVQVMEVGPPSGGIIILDGAALDADDCVDSDGSTIGSSMVCSRGKNAAGTAVWICTSDKKWVDTGASD